jgi:hypothetical protein
MIEAFDDETLGGDRAMFHGNNKEDIQSLLEGFQAELIRVSDSVAKVDSMLCVPMLGKCRLRIFSSIVHLGEISFRRFCWSRTRQGGR